MQAGRQDQNRNRQEAGLDVPSPRTRDTQTQPGWRKAFRIPYEGEAIKEPLGGREGDGGLGAECKTGKSFGLLNPLSPPLGLKTSSPALCFGG